MEDMNKSRIDWIITLIPFLSIIILTLMLIINPDNAHNTIDVVRLFFGDKLGTFYLLIGLGIFLCSIYIAFSKYGQIVLGEQYEKPKYSFFTWGSMMFTCGLAADILFYSFSEWVMYASNSYIEELGTGLDWVGVFPMFHWSFIPWSFYLVLAVAFGFMMHVRKRNKQRFSEACRPIIRNHADGIFGRIIDLFALFALLAGTATTFSVATPLMSEILTNIFHFSASRITITIVILIATCVVYTYAVLHGFKGISILSKICISLFIGILAFVFIAGNEALFIVEYGIQSIGKMVQHFIELSTYTDPLRQNCFPQDWTIYYWAYWMVWCVAAPFFIGSISRGRTIKQTILGGYLFGVGSTILSFIVLGNYGVALQAKGIADFIEQYNINGDLYSLILNIINTLPAAKIIMILTILCMITFYATSFDSIAYTAACYSYFRLKPEDKPDRRITLLWCVLLIALPMALTFSESSMSNIQSVSIISAFPIGIIIIITVLSFFKDIKNYYDEQCFNKDK